MCAWCSLPTWIWCIRSSSPYSSSSAPQTPSTPAVKSDPTSSSPSDDDEKWYVRCGRGIRCLPFKCKEGCKRISTKGCGKKEVVVNEEDKGEKVTESTTRVSQIDPFLSSADQVEPSSSPHEEEEEQGLNDLTRIKTRTPDLVQSVVVPAKGVRVGFVERCKGLVGGSGGKKEEK